MFRNKFGLFSGDSNVVSTNQSKIELETLLPGRNYSITVQAVSKDVQSKEQSIYVVTKPSAPIIEDLKPMVIMVDSNVCLLLAMTNMCSVCRLMD